MYKSKKEVDAHVRSALSKLRTETERHLRSFTIAKLYYKINEYSSAEQYLVAYLSAKEDNDQAHKLLGQCYQRLKKPEKALQSFQRSLQLNPKQQDVLVEVCQLLLEDKNLNTNKAKYWCELAESEKVQHDAVFSLRLKLLNKDNLETNQVEEMIQKEIIARPQDVQLRVRLVRSYIEQSKILDAFKYVYNLELAPISGESTNFSGNSEWYNIVWLVLSKYEQMPNTKKDWEFWLLLAICLERQVAISFSLTTGNSMGGGVTETANLLFSLDQYLHKISQLSDKLSAQKELVTLFLDHFRGQLLLHATALMFKRELQQNKNKWKETVKAVLPLLLMAFQIEPPDNKEPWMKHCDEQGKRLIQQWNREGAFRCAQVGRTLLSCILDEHHNKENGTLQLNNVVGNHPTLWTSGDELITQIRQTCSDKQWRRNVFSLLFCNSDQKVKELSSLLVKCSKLAEPTFDLPSYAEVERYEEVAQYLKPESLPHMVYLCLGNDNLAYVRAKYFSGLNFSTQNLSFCGAESLNQLDMDTFLYAAALQAKRMMEVERDAFDNYNSGSRNAAGKPRILLFANLQAQLCNEEQTNWWLAAYQVYKNLTTDNLAELRANLQYGIEAVRGINGPKIDMAIVFRLGQIFVSRAQDIVKPVEKAFLEARAESIYKYGLNMLKMHNKGVLEPFRKYFKYVKSNTSQVEREVSAAAEDAVSYLATRFFKKAEYEELIEELAGIQLPFATYLQAEAYRKLDEANKTPKKAKRMYLDRASECLTQTLALLKSTHTDPNHPLNSVIHAELKRLQQSTAKFLNDSVDAYSSAPIVHNNSSAYEDAEEEFFTDASLVLPSAANRARRNVQATLIASPRNNELESLVKQMANTLSFVKEEIIDTIKPELNSICKEMASLKDKMAQLEDAMKKSHISSNPPSRDDASNVLDDLYIIEDALQNQIYQQTTAAAHLPTLGNSNIFPVTSVGPVGVSSNYAVATTQQQRIHAANNLQMQPNVAAAAAYNAPMFNPNYSMNYYTPPYMMTPQGAAGTGAIMGPRNALSLPYMEASPINFNMPNTSLLPPPPPIQEGRINNLYGLLTQPAPTNTAPPQLPQLSVATSMPMAPPLASSAVATQTAVVANTTPAAVTNMAQTQLPPSAAGVTTFNKAINNQPVEKGPPANVVITSSDPLPNPNSVALQSQQPTLSVTIPSYHIKPSVVQPVEPVLPSVPITNSQTPSAAPAVGGFAGLSLNTLGGNSPFGGFPNSGGSIFTTPAGNSSGTSLGSMSSNKGPSSGSSFMSTPTSISTTTFTFKPQVMQAAAAAAAQAKDKTADESGQSSDLNKSGLDGEAEYDPRPDFKPIIPLPDEVEVKTGEEDEEVMFCYRAKLYRHADNEWKERGIGNIKILKNKEGYSRLLMRRDQTHKICANHKLTPELILTTPKNETKGHIWAANDFADETLKLEKFFVRFKLPETANQFYEAFKRAQKEAEKLGAKQNGEAPPSTQTKTETKMEKAAAAVSATPFTLSKSAVTNFATSTPATKTEAAAKPAVTQPVAAAVTTIGGNSTTTTSTVTSGVSKTLFSGLNLSTKTADNAKPAAGVSPFANFSFGTAVVPPSTTTTASPFSNAFRNFAKPTTGGSLFGSTNLPSFQSPALVSAVTGATTAVSVSAAANTSTTSGLNKSNVSDAEDDYVPTAQFNPVIPLPDLVEVTTGEENEIVLFEHRAKLLRFDKDAGEWKDRGLGNMKLLQQKDDLNKVRLVMRREQVHKLCCNQRLYKDIVFKYAKNSQTALSWAGQDYSENELITEMLTVRFKTSETCKQFHEAVLKAQANMTADANEQKAKEQEQELNKKSASAADKEQTKGFGEQFKPKAGSWTCQACYINNTADKLYCVACDAPKDETVPKKEPANNALLSTTNKNTFSFGFGAAGTTTTVSAGNNAKPTFTFGLPVVSTTPATNTTTVGSTTPSASASKSATAAGSNGFGDQFKPKAGSWTCQSCYISNTGDKQYCVACDTPKDDTVPKKETTSSVLSLANPTQKFSFGFAAAGAGATGAASAADAAKSTPTGGFTFGAATANKSDPSKSLFGNLGNAAAGDTSKSFTFTPPTSTSTSVGMSSNTTSAKPTFSFSLQSKAMEEPPTSSADTSSTPFSLDKKNFSFTLKPKSPGKVGKSPLKFGGAAGDADGAPEDGDDSHYHEEEENNTYFTPVIPLPEKIDVKTGEENEEVLYVHRAKLYRFMESEWRERGLGDVKILRHKETQKLRVVMRRDQVLKICLNHALNADVEYKRKDDKSWLFVVHDFSEGAVELEKFSLRFKNKDIAEEFMSAVKSALAGTAAAIEAADTTTSPIKEEDQLAFNISDIDKQTADKLHLPYYYYATTTATCAGCRGCDSDKFVFPTPQTKEAFVNESEDKEGLGPLEMPALTLPKANRSLLKQSALATTKTTADSSTGAVTKPEENLFSGFGSANAAEKNKSASTFSFTAALNSSNKPDDKPVSGGFLFGSNSGSIFGGTDKNSVFGQKASIFGSNTIGNGASNTATDMTKSIFSGSGSAVNSTTTTGSIFGGKPVFGGPPTIFSGAGSGGTDTSSKPNGTEASKTSIFANSSATDNQSGKSIFGSSPVTFGSSFGSKPSLQTSIFGGSSMGNSNNNTTTNTTNASNANTTAVNNNSNSNNSFTFGSIAKAAETAPTFADLSSNTVDFASLAAKASTNTTPIGSKSSEKASSGGFIGLTNQDAFSSFLSSKDKANNNSVEAAQPSNNNANQSFKSVDDSTTNEENYDPHYDPIIALPNEIVVSTGEEEEKKLFGERATLFRWDDTNKEWKERGVGELKVLYHPTHQTYRLVMRREQIHKLVLNHNVGADFTFKNMNNNPKSFAWATKNYAESTEGELEKLAVRFKKVDLAEQFNAKLNECIETAKQRTAIGQTH